MSDLTATSCGCGCSNTTSNNGGCGNSMIWIIILLFLCGGCGGNGGGFGGNGGIGENYVLATDFATIERKLDGINETNRIGYKRELKQELDI
mgnify:CR=1 FL=1